MAEDITPKYPLTPSSEIPGGLSAADVAVGSVASSGTMIQPSKEPLGQMIGPMAATANTLMIGSGDDSFNITALGIWLGAANFADALFSVDMQGNLIALSATISGVVTAATIDIGGSDASSFHVDIDGNIWSGSATFAGAPFSVSNAGVITGTSGTIGGVTMSSTTLVVGSGANAITIDSATGAISSNGSAWSFNGDGTFVLPVMKLLTSGTFNTTATNATFTADDTNDTITSNGHNLQDGDKVVLTTSGTLPAGLSLTTGYFVRDKTANTFKLCANHPYAAAIDITDTGTGTHTWTNVSGTIKVTFSAKDKLQIKMRAPHGTTNAQLGCNLNTDGDITALNYGTANVTDGGAVNTNSNTSRWIAMIGGDNTGSLIMNMFIDNQATKKKLASWTGNVASDAAGTASVANTTQGSGVWDNTTDQITTMLFFLTSTAGFDAGATVWVYGQD